MAYLKIDAVLATMKEKVKQDFSQQNPHLSSFFFLVMVLQISM